MFGIFLCTFVLLNVNTWNREIEKSYCMIKILILGWRNYCIWKLYRIRWFLYGFLACWHLRGRCFQIIFKQVQLTQFWPKFRIAIFVRLNFVSIKQVQLTQFWPTGNGKTSLIVESFQSSKFDLLNSDSSLWRARRGAPSEGRFAKPQKSEKFLQNFCIYFIQSNFKNYKKSSKYSCKINRLQR